MKIIAQLLPREEGGESTHTSLGSESEVFGEEPILAKEESDSADSNFVQNSLLGLQTK